MAEMPTGTIRTPRASARNAANRVPERQPTSGECGRVCPGGEQDLLPLFPLGEVDFNRAGLPGDTLGKWLGLCIEYHQRKRRTAFSKGSSAEPRTGQDGEEARTRRGPDQNGAGRREEGTRTRHTGLLSGSRPNRRARQEPCLFQRLTSRAQASRS